MHQQLDNQVYCYGRYIFTQTQIQRHQSHHYFFKGKDLITKQNIFLKVFDSCVECCKKAESELEILTTLQCENNPNIIKLIGSFKTNDSIVGIGIVTEYCEKTLKDFIEDIHGEGSQILRKDLLEKVVDLIRQIIIGMASLYEKRIAHMDLKPENILLKDDVIKLNDFDISQVLDESEKFIRKNFTQKYRPIEHLNNPSNSYSARLADIYSLGIVFYELFFGLIKDEKGQEIIDFQQMNSRMYDTLNSKINQNKITNPHLCGYYQLILSMIDRDPISRIKWPQLIRSLDPEEKKQTETSSSEKKKEHSPFVLTKKISASYQFDLDNFKKYQESTRDLYPKLPFLEKCKDSISIYMMFLKFVIFYSHFNFISRSSGYEIDVIQSLIVEYNNHRKDYNPNIGNQGNPREQNQFLKLNREELPEELQIDKNGKLNAKYDQDNVPEMENQNQLRLTCSFWHHFIQCYEKFAQELNSIKTEDQTYVMIEIRLRFITVIDIFLEIFELRNTYFLGQHEDGKHYFLGSDELERKLREINEMPERIQKIEKKYIGILNNWLSRITTF